MLSEIVATGPRSLCVMPVSDPLSHGCAGPEAPPADGMERQGTQRAARHNTGA
jgi:hypothetical protein